MHRLIWTIVLLLGGSLAVAQSPDADTVWVRMTVHWDSLHTYREAQMPRTLAPISIGTEAASTWLRAAQRGRVQAYADAARQVPIPRKTLRAMLQPYRQWTKRVSRITSNADHPHLFYLAIDRQERWQEGQPRQVLGTRVVLLPWDSAAAPVRTWHLAPDDPLLRRVIPQVFTYRDYTLDHDASALAAWDHHHLNDRQLTPSTTHTPARAEPDRGTTSRWVKLRLPSELNGTNSLWNVPISRAQQDATERLVKATAKALMPELLRRRLPMYYGNLPRKLPRDEAATVVRQHPLVIGDPSKRKDIRELDFSFAVIDLQVGGTLRRDPAGQVRFEAETVELVWRNDTRDLAIVSLGVIRLADAARLGIQVQGLPIRAALSQLTGTYGYVIQLNDYAPTHLDASYDLYRLLWSGDWHLIPRHAVHEAQFGLGAVGGQ